MRGLVTHYVLFFLDLASRRVKIAGVTQHPREAWMLQRARSRRRTGPRSISFSFPFAGEHTSVWIGYMNGALETGERCAQEIMGVLGSCIECPQR